MTPIHLNMKRGMAVAVLGTCVAMTAFSQVNVLKNGQTLIGLPEGASETSASVVVLPLSSESSEATMAFGKKGEILFGQSAGSEGVLEMRGQKGLRFMTSNGAIVEYIPSVSPLFNFSAGLRAGGFLLPSAPDGASASLTSASTSLLSLSPVEYSVADGTAYGFRAGEVEQLLPALVKAASDGTKGVDVGSMVPLLVDIVKRLSSEVERQKAIIVKLQNATGVDAVSAFDGGESSSRLVSATMAPGGRLNVDFVLDEEVASAYLTVSDMQGKTLLRTSLDSNGTGSVTIEGLDMPDGIYTCSLMADGRECGTIKFVMDR